MDIVERLRSENAIEGMYDPPGLQVEAAAEIERLRAKLAEAEKLIDHIKHTHPSAYQSARAAQRAPF